MARYVAFLRAMNTGGRRITNEKLCAQFGRLGYTNVSAFLTSGNVVFEAPGGSRRQITARIEDGLAEALGYEVPVFLRTEREVRAIATGRPFSPKVERDAGRLQIIFLSKRPAGAAGRAVEALSSDEDRLVLGDREIYWLPRGGLAGSKLALPAIDAALGPMTLRTKRSIERLAAKYLIDTRPTL